MVWSWKNVVQLTDRSYIIAGSANRIFVSLLRKKGVLNVTEVALIAERKSANMAYQ